MNDCDASEPTPLLAFNVSGYEPPVPAAGVPDSTPVDVFRLTPDGNDPASEYVLAGYPELVTENDPADPTVNVALDADVNAGASSTVSVNDCDVPDPTPFVAPKEMAYEPPVPAAGVPDNTPVDRSNVTPDGNDPDCEYFGVGYPDAITVNEPSDPAVNVALDAEVNAGASSTVNVNDWVAGVPTPLLAPIVIVYEPPVPAAGAPDSVPDPSRSS